MHVLGQGSERLMKILRLPCHSTSETSVDNRKLDTSGMWPLTDKVKAVSCNQTSKQYVQPELQDQGFASLL